jgi:hypothetical protein
MVFIASGKFQRRKGGEQYVLHYENLAQDEISWHEGIRVVSPAVSIEQGINASVPAHLVRQAIEKALRLGLVPKQSLVSLTKQLEVST